MDENIINNRLEKLEKEVAEITKILKKGNCTNASANSSTFGTYIPSSRRTKWRYNNGKILDMRNIALNVVKDLVKDPNRNIRTYDDFCKLYDPLHNQGYIGVIKKIEEAKEYRDYEKHFFMDEKDWIILDDGTYVVTKEWVKGKFLNFVKTSVDLGINIRNVSTGTR